MCRRRRSQCDRLTLASVSPWYLLTTSGPLSTRTGQPMAPATARASNVFPGPGGPYSNIPRGGLKPSCVYASGRRSAIIAVSRIRTTWAAWPPTVSRVAPVTARGYSVLGACEGVSAPTGVEALTHRTRASDAITAARVWTSPPAPHSSRTTTVIGAPNAVTDSRLPGARTFRCAEEVGTTQGGTLRRRCNGIGGGTASAIVQWWAARGGGG